MPLPLTRRSLLIGSASLAAATALRPAFAAAPGLTISSRTLDVKGRAATVYGLTGPDGRPGLFARQGDRFPGLVTNASAEAQTLHWHGQILAPWDQDRARPGGGSLAAGASDNFDFELTPGTHWMHSHTLAEQQLLAAPMVTARADEVEPEATVILHDFSFSPPAELLEGLTHSPMHDMAAMGDTKAPAKTGDMAGMDMSGMDMGGMAMPGMTHANDIAYDAYLANDRTLDDPQVITVEPGPFRLRLINAATATAFWVDASALSPMVVAVDGNPVAPMPVGLVPMAQGQRVDLMLTIPPEPGAWPVLAHVESATMRTGVILATQGAAIARVADQAATPSPALGLDFDARLTAMSPLAEAKTTMMHLTLGMEPGYRWTINGAAHGEAAPLQAALGSRVEMMFMNPTMMMHPMHLHGHHFQIVDVGMGRFNGPRRDVVAVPPGAMITVAVDFDKPGDWFLHCHHLYHMASGMMTSVTVS
jgi:FtsP/CotA-like multicopper oxidase with cupredoxin domain